MVDCWKSGPLANILSEFSAEDIFNCDETGLVDKIEPEPSKSYVLKGKKCTGGKRPKKHITVQTCANITGTEKIPLLAIGKYQRP